MHILTKHSLLQHPLCKHDGRQSLTTSCAEEKGTFQELTPHVTSRVSEDAEVPRREVKLALRDHFSPMIREGSVPGHLKVKPDLHFTSTAVACRSENNV